MARRAVVKERNRELRQQLDREEEELKLKFEEIGRRWAADQTAVSKGAPTELFQERVIFDIFP